MNGSDPQEADPVSRYMLRLRRALSSLPEGERIDIVAEIHSHIAERASPPGRSVHDVLAALGEPEALANGYLDDRELSHALRRSSPGRLLAAVLGRATRSLTALSVGLASVVLYAFALSLTLTAVLKPIMPRNVGLGHGAHGIQFGLPAAPPASADALGLWIVPLALVAAVLCYLAATGLIKAGGRTLLRRSGTPPA